MDAFELLDEAGRVPPAADATIEAAVDLLLGAAAEEKRRSTGAEPNRQPRPRPWRRLVLAVIAGLTSAAVIVAAVLLSSGGDGTPPARPATAPLPAHTVRYQVFGYTSAQAMTAAAKCLKAVGSVDAGAALRATFRDALGSILVMTTSSGFFTCNEPQDGIVTPYIPFATYAQIQGHAPLPGDPSAHWLLHPVELDAGGGGLPSKTDTSGWVSYAIGRVAPNVTRVTIATPGEPAVTAAVENGFFVARQLLPSQPPLPQGPGTVPIMGYDSSGALVFDSLTTSTAIPPGTTGVQSLPTSFPCWVTPSGQPVSPASPGETCQTAIAWGY